MTAEQVGVVANWVLTILSLLGVVWISAVRITSLQVKVDTIWSFLMKRALSEALVQGVATHNSPVRVTDEAKRWMGDLFLPSGSSTPSWVAVISPMRNWHWKLRDGSAIEYCTKFACRMDFSWEHAC